MFGKLHQRVKKSPGFWRTPLTFCVTRYNINEAMKIFGKKLIISKDADTITGAILPKSQAN